MKARRWKTWAKHLALDAGIVFACSLFFSAPESFRIAAAWRLFREIEQQLPKWRVNTAGQWVGAFGDVGSGWIGGGAMWWILTL